MKKYIPILIIIIAAISVYSLGLHHYLNLETLKENKALLKELIKDNKLLFSLIYSASYIGIVALSIPGATIMTITSGLLLGQALGTCISVISATIGGSILFLSAKMASKDLIKRQTSSKWVHRMKKGFEENAVSYLLT